LLASTGRDPNFLGGRGHFILWKDIKTHFFHPLPFVGASHKVAEVSVVDAAFNRPRFFYRLASVPFSLFPHRSGFSAVFHDFLSFERFPAVRGQGPFEARVVSLFRGGVSFLI